MKVKQLTMSAILLAIGAILHYIVPEHLQVLNQISYYL